MDSDEHVHMSPDHSDLQDSCSLLCCDGAQEATQEPRHPRIDQRPAIAGLPDDVTIDTIYHPRNLRRVGPTPPSFLRHVRLYLLRRSSRWQSWREWHCEVEGAGSGSRRVNSRLGPVSELTARGRFSGRAEPRLEPRLIGQRASLVSTPFCALGAAERRLRRARAILFGGRNGLATCARVRSSGFGDGSLSRRRTG